MSKVKCKLCRGRRYMMIAGWICTESKCRRCRGTGAEPSRTTPEANLDRERNQEDDRKRDD